jgi:hypothetical protein
MNRPGKKNETNSIGKKKKRFVIFRRKIERRGYVEIKLKSLSALNF